MNAPQRYMGTLYKVLTASGCAPYVAGYFWSLPQYVDGAWVPGDWHEESTVNAEPCRKGLHLTAFPLQWGGGDEGRVVWHVEAEGVLGDPLRIDKVIAARVRLTRPVTEEELQRLRDEQSAREGAARAEAEAVRLKWEAEAPARAAKEAAERAEYEAQEAKRKAELEEYEKQERKEKMQRLSALAREQREELAAARAKGVKSTALHTFDMLDAITSHSSWREINTSRFAALKFLVRFVAFEREDFGKILRENKGGYWIGENGAENLYALAIESKNTSAVLSIEAYLGRKPFWRMYGGKKVRTSLGDQIRVDGRSLKVTSIRDDKGYLNAREYREVKRGSYTDEERVGGVVKVTHAQLLAGSTKAQNAEAAS